MARREKPGTDTPAAPQFPAYVVERWPMDRLRKSARNARKHPERQIEQLRRSLRTWGWTIPVLAREDGELIAGEGRFDAAKLERFTEAPVIVARGWTDEQCRAYALADNKLAQNSEWNDGLLDAELASLKEGGFDIGLAGFDDMAASLPSEKTLEVKEVETGLVADRFWISIRGPLAHQARTLQILRDALASLPAVDVELGTTAVE